jgi:hypothetical protein
MVNAARTKRADVGNERIPRRGWRGSALGMAASVSVTVALGVVALAGCPGSLENPEAFDDASTVCDAPGTILGPRCATSNCHDAEDPISNLDLTPDDGLAARLVGVPGVDCAGTLVDTTSPETSLLFTKCLAENTCAARMPITGAKLTADEEQCLLEWLSSL